MGFATHAGESVLEIGPGLGTDHAQFARAGGKMVAIDLTSRHLELTRRRFELEKLATRPVRGDAEGLPFAAGAFDVVYSFGVLHHTPDTAGAVREIHRVLRPGGLAIVGLTTATRPFTGSTRSSGAGSGSASCGARAIAACSPTSSSARRGLMPCRS